MKVQNKALKAREKKLFELAEKNKKDTGRKNIREKNEVTPLRDEDYHIDPNLEIVQHRKFTMREFISKLESNNFKIDDFDKLFPGKEFT